MALLTFINLAEVIKANGVTLGEAILADLVAVYPSEEPIFKNTELVSEAIDKSAASVGVTDPFPDPPILGSSPGIRTGPHLDTTYVPPLRSVVSFALRSVGATHFAGIWLDVKDRELNGGILLLLGLRPCSKVFAPFQTRPS